MTRKRLWRRLRLGLGRPLALATLVAVAAAAPAAAATQLTPAQATFPERAFVLSTGVPLALDARSLQVRENGDGVHGLTVVAANGTGAGTFGVVLVVDASNSMRGRAIRDALAAARAFATHTAGSVAVGLVTFNSRPRVVTAPTTDTSRLTAALAATPQLAEGTYVYDATARAVGLLQQEHVTAGSVILLTDGRDTGSRLAAADVAKQARAARVRIFAIGLRSAQFDPAALQQLARDTGAAYAEAQTTASLTRIYDSLSAHLASEYLLRYRSAAAPDTAVQVEVRAQGLGGIARWSYHSPAGLARGFHRSLLDRFVASRLSVLAMALVAAALVGLGVLVPLARARRDLRARIGDFLTVRTETGATVKTEPRFDGVARALERIPWWAALVEELDVAGLDVAPGSVAVATGAVTLVAFCLLAVLAPLLALLALGIPLVVRYYVRGKVRARRDAFAEQLPDNLLVMAAALRAGHSFVGALTAVLEEAEEPSRSELQRAVADERLGVRVEEGLLRVARRMDNGDLEQVALVASLQRETGGRTADVLDTVVVTVRERAQLRRLVKTLTAQGQVSRWVLTGLPVVVAALISVLNPSYLGPLFTTSGGQVLLVVTLVLLLAGFLTIKRIVDIEI